MEEGYRRLKSLTGLYKEEILNHLSSSLNNSKEVNMYYLNQDDILVQIRKGESYGGNYLFVTTNFRQTDNNPYNLTYDVYDALFENEGVLKWVDRDELIDSNPIKAVTSTYNFKDNYTTIKFYLLDRDFPPTFKFINWVKEPWSDVK